jgi:hypothetical protein
MLSTTVLEEFLGAVENLKEVLVNPNDMSLNRATRLLIQKVLLCSNDNIAWKEVKRHEQELIMLMAQAVEAATVEAVKKTISQRVVDLREVLDTRSITLSPSAKKCLTEQYGDKGDIKKIFDFLEKNDDENL